MSEFTPGPWDWMYSDATFSRPIALQGPKGDVILCSEDEDGPRAYVSRADQALISVAPELYALALEIAKDYPDAADWKDARGQLLSMAEAAITKVKGA